MTSTDTTLPTTDPRRITELDADYQRLHRKAVIHLTRSLAQYVRALRLLPPAEHQHAASDFITRHIALLSTSYQQAHREGQRDWYVPRSRTPGKWITPADRTKLRQRLAFYAAASVAKLAREGMEAARLSAAVLSESITLASDQTDPLDEWQGGTGIRLELQGQIVWTGLQDGYGDAGANDPANPYRWLWWDLEPMVKMHCPECPPLAEGSPYDPPWMAGGNILTTVPGAGATECGAGCRCALRYGSEAEANSVYWFKLYSQAMKGIAQSGIVPQAWRDLFPAGVSTAAAQPEEPPQRFQDSIGALMDPEALTSNAGALGGALEQDALYQQQAAQDAYRSVWDAWDVARGDLPQLPRLSQMFSTGEHGTDGAVSFEQFIEALPPWEQQTPELQQLLHRWVDALLRLGGQDVIEE